MTHGAMLILRVFKIPTALPHGDENPAHAGILPTDIFIQKAL